MKGFTTLSSFYIIKGELHVKNRSHSLKLSIDPNQQVLLSQLQMAVNCLRKCNIESKSIKPDDIDHIRDVKLP